MAECDKGRWTYAVRDGNEMPLIAFALTKLPNLTSVILQDFNSEERLPANGELFFTINRMIAPLVPFYGTGIPEALPSSRNQPISPLMPNLTYVWVEPGFNPENPETFIDGGAIEAFAALPSVKVINGHRIGGGEEDVELAEPLENSHATTLNLSACDISLQRKFRFLEGFTYLESCTYWPSSRTEPSQTYEPLLYVWALMIGAKNTLRRLTLRSASDNASYMGSLRRFEALEYLETDLISLVGDFSQTNKTLEASLPPNIQEVILYDDSSDSHCYEDQLDSLAEEKESSTPHLSRFKFVFPFGRVDGTGITDWTKTFKEAGISLEFEDYDSVPPPVFSKSHTISPYHVVQHH